MIDNIKRFFIGLCYVAGCYLVIIAVVVIYTYGRKIINNEEDIKKKCYNNRFYYKSQ